MAQKYKFKYHYANYMQYFPRFSFIIYMKCINLKEGGRWEVGDGKRDLGFGIWEVGFTAQKKVANLTTLSYFEITCYYFSIPINSTSKIRLEKGLIVPRSAAPYAKS